MRSDSQLTSGTRRSSTNRLKASMHSIKWSASASKSLRSSRQLELGTRSIFATAYAAEVIYPRAVPTISLRIVC